MNSAIEGDRKMANDTSTDINWKTFWIWFAIVMVINGIIRSIIQPLSSPMLEQVLFYCGFVLGHFLMPAILVVPLHLIGRRINPIKGDRPKKQVAVWGTIISTLMMLVELVRVAM